MAVPKTCMLFVRPVIAPRCFRPNIRGQAIEERTLNMPFIIDTPSTMVM